MRPRTPPAAIGRRRLIRLPTRPQPLVVQGGLPDQAQSSAAGHVAADLLGLSVTYGIVQEHGGTLTCESHPEQGTRFQLTLPRLTVSPVEAVAR